MSKPRFITPYCRDSSHGRRKSASSRRTQIDRRRFDDGVDDAIAPQFEKATGQAHHPFRLYPNIIARINSGTPFDVVVVPDDVFKDAPQGALCVCAARRYRPGRYGIIVRAGAPKPDISTADAFKKACSPPPRLLPAGKCRWRLHHQSVRSPRHFRGSECKTKVQAAPAAIASAVANGEAELGVFLTNVLIAPGVGLVGPFPGDLQQELVFASAVAAPQQGNRRRKSVDRLPQDAGGDRPHQSRRHDARLTGILMTSLVSRPIRSAALQNTVP